MTIINVTVNKIYTVVLITLICFMSFPLIAGAGGISVDAGLTPPLDRWIVKTQTRFMRLGDDSTQMNRKMNMYMFPVIVAYGLRPDLTVMLRQPFVLATRTEYALLVLTVMPGVVFEFDQR